MLAAIVDKRLPFIESWRASDEGRLEELLGQKAAEERQREADARDVDLEPHVALWHKEKSQEGRKGASSADKYLAQLRTLIPERARFPRSQFTRKRIWSWLDTLDCSDPTRTRYKAAVNSFAKYLLKHDLIDSNPVRDIKGYADARARERYYEREAAQRLIGALPQPLQPLRRSCAARA